MATKSIKQMKPKEKKPYKKAEYEEFVRFVALPRVLRQKEFGFHTDDHFMKKYHLSSFTIYEWKKGVDFWDRVSAIRKRWGYERTPDVLLALYKAAVTTGRAAEVLAWMKIVEDWGEKDERSSTSRNTLLEIQNNIRQLIREESNKDRAK